MDGLNFMGGQYLIMKYSEREKCISSLILSRSGRKNKEESGNDHFFEEWFKKDEIGIRVVCRLLGRYNERYFFLKYLAKPLILPLCHLVFGIIPFLWNFERNNDARILLPRDDMAEQQGRGKVRNYKIRKSK